MAEPSCPCFFTIEVIKRLEKYVDENQEAIKGGAWVEGQGWDQTLWEVEEFPSAVSRNGVNNMIPGQLMVT